MSTGEPPVSAPRADDPRRDGSPPLERREVRASDPHLSDETNARLTEELREIVGADVVEVPVDRERIAEGEYALRPTWTGYLTQNRVNIVRLLLIALTFEPCRLLAQ